MYTTALNMESGTKKAVPLARDINVIIIDIVMA